MYFKLRDCISAFCQSGWKFLMYNWYKIKLQNRLEMKLEKHFSVDFLWTFFMGLQDIMFKFCHKSFEENRSSWKGFPVLPNVQSMDRVNGLIGSHIFLHEFHQIIFLFWLKYPVKDEVNFRGDMLLWWKSF